MSPDSSTPRTSPRVRILDRNTINQIAAGEVIERPASVVKEMVENAIDAGADRIIVRVEDGGKKRIEIEDNGCGMSREDAILAFEKHATSKLSKIEDLDTVTSLGFRGEALPSIASVSRVELTTRRQDSTEEEGVLIRIEGGEKQDIKAVSRAPGTKIVVKELFFNVPARRNYLKTPRTELNHIMDIMTRYALYHGDISMQLFSEGERIMNSPKSPSLLANIATIYGKNTAKEFMELDYARDFFTIRGYISKPSVNRASRAHQHIYVNGRYVKSDVVYKGIKTAYGNLLPKDRYPLAVLKLEIHQGKVDVNVHPTKEEVRFSDDFVIMEGVINAVRYQLYQHQLLGDGAKLGRPLGGETASRQEPLGGGKVEERPTVMEATTASSSAKKSVESSSGKEPAAPLPAEEERPLPDARGLSQEDLEKVRRPEASLKANEERPKPVARESNPYLSPQNHGIARQLRINPEDEKDRGLLARAKHLKTKSKYVDTGNVPTMTAVGQIFDLFILAAGTDSLYIIDQHAVHEKIVYERLRKEVELKSQGSKQRLIEAVSFECSPSEEAVVKEQLPLLGKLGFEMAYFGRNTFLVKAVPSVLGQAVEKELIFDIIEELLDNYKQKKVVDALDMTIKTIACHSAIRKGRTLSLEEMDRLIRELHQAENPYACPHGRPTIISISTEELEKRFKRR